MVGPIMNLCKRLLLLFIFISIPKNRSFTAPKTQNPTKKMPNKRQHKKITTQIDEYSSSATPEYVSSSPEYVSPSHIRNSDTKQTRTKAVLEREIIKVPVAKEVIYQKAPKDRKIKKNKPSKVSNESSLHISDMIENKYQDYVKDVPKKPKRDTIELSVYNEQHGNWRRENDKLHQKIRDLKAQINDQHQDLVDLENHRKNLKDTIKDLKHQNQGLNKNCDDFEINNHHLLDEIEVLKSRLLNLENDYDTMKLAKDKIIQSLDNALDDKVNDIELMKEKLIIWHEEINQLGNEYDTAVQEFNDSNDELMRRNEKLKNKCQQFLKQQMDDIEDRKKLLKQIKKLQDEKAQLRRDLTKAKKAEVMDIYDTTEEISVALQAPRNNKDVESDFTTDDEQEEKPTQKRGKKRPKTVYETTVVTKL